MKKRNKFVAAMLTIVLLVLLIIPAAAQEPEMGIAPDIAALMKAQECAVAAHRTLISSFDWDEARNDYAYPDNYGGDYISENTLVIQLVNPTEEDYAYYTGLLEDYVDHIAFEEVDYSYNFLQSASEDTFEDLSDELEITGYGVRMSQNSVVLYVKSNAMATGLSEQNTNEENISKLKLPRYIQIEEGENDTLSATLYGGDLIGNGSSSFTLGACGFYGGAIAIVTCGHGGHSVGSTLYYGSGTSTPIGTVKKQNYGSGLYGDYAIATVTYSHTLSKYVHNAAGYVLINTYDENPAEGTVVSKYGETTGYSYGTITGTNYTAGYGTKGLTVVQISGSNGIDYGDSGGPWYYNDSSLGYVFCGITSGKNGDNTVAYFTPYKYILRNGGFTVAS